MPKILKYIDKIGLEIEAAWIKNRTDLVPDGSVTREGFSNCEGYDKIKSVGELVSPPLSYEDAMEFIAKNWGDFTQPKAGFHVHLSFLSINSYNQLMNENFYKQFISDMEKFGKEYPVTNQLFWDRLEGKNKFCTRKFVPEAQVKLKQKGNDTRYGILNYCWGMHKTLECRLFPTFINYKTAQAALTAFVDSVENYLEKAAPIKEIVEEEVSFDESEKRDSMETKNLFKLKPFSLYAGWEDIKLGKSNKRNPFARPFTRKAKKNDNVFGQILENTAPIWMTAPMTTIQGQTIYSSPEPTVFSENPTTTLDDVF